MERDQTDQQYNQTYKHFNSHAHVERDAIWHTWRNLQWISTHTLTWSVTTHFTALLLYYTNFNSHAHVERDLLKTRCLVLQKYFNSHAHVERDRLKLKRKILYTISTHTLTWSVTLRGSSQVFVVFHFNSHAHVERDTRRTE